MREPIYLNIEFDGITRTLPVNPENLVIKRTASNEDINIIGLGPATRKGQPGLLSMQFKSFFPCPYSNFYIYDVTPEDYIDFINRIWETENINNKVAKLVTQGLDKNLSMWFVIDSFDYEYRGGDFDVWYTLSIKEYVPYGVKIQNIQNEGMGQDRPASTITVPEKTDKTYTVVSGDSLWAIAKRCTGDGSKWKALYDLNANVIGTNPNSIKPGQVLILPEDWDSPKVLTTKKASSNSGNKTNKAISSTTNSTASSDNTSITNPQADRDNALKEYFEAHKKAEDYLKYIEENKDNDNLVQTMTNNTFLSRDKYELQESYKKVARVNASPNLSESEKIKAIQAQKELEEKMYSRMPSQYYTKQKTVEAGKKLMGIK